MNFLKRLFDSRPFTLPELISLNAKDGLYRGEILKELKSVVLFIGLAEQPTGLINFDDPSLEVLSIPTQDGRGLLLLTFVDQASLKTAEVKSFPYMVDFRTISKIMGNPVFFGLIVCSGKEYAPFTKQEITSNS